MKTVVSTDRAAAVELLRRGEVVALPTETVYGLAGDALNPIAVAKIFEAKGRPRFDPLIVHLPNREWLEKIADLPTRGRQLVLRLAEKFWPGPFTMVLPKREIVPGIVTAGLETVAIRISANPSFAQVAKEFGKPLAAPSANRFGRISPTTAKHVLDELGGQIPLIIDAGPTTHGIESTIVRVEVEGITILRRGPITSEQLSEFGTVGTAKEREKISAPGQSPSHYAPKTPLRIINDLNWFESNRRCALLAWTPTKDDARFAAVRNLSESRDLREAAANLFRHLHDLDSLGLDLIVAERVPSRGLGAAIMDRLERAAHGSSQK
ncbi:MAG: L-threonylcarbamoyladenylate synthase [Nitrospirota bacterium]